MEFATLTHQACGLIKTVGGFVKQELGQVRLAHIETKGPNSLVSYVDKTAETMLVKGLSDLLPGAVFLTEEDTVVNEEGDWQWIIDPLDGTTNFLHQIPFFSISVALRHQGELVVGIVHEVIREECFYAWKGGGAYCNDQGIEVSSTATLGDALIATGFPTQDRDQIIPYLGVFQDLLPRIRGIRRLGSAALDLAYVACGRFDGYYEYGINAWDIAAGGLIVREAGGSVSTFSGASDFLFTREIIAAPPVIHQSLQAIIQPNLVPWMYPSFYSIKCNCS